MEERKEFPDRPWDLDEVAQYLKVSPRTVWDLIRNHGLPSRKIGGSTRFVRAEVDAWIAEQQPSRGKSEGPEAAVA